VDELIVRPKYSRQTGTQRKKRGEPDNDMFSTAFAAKMLVVVVFLSVFALCKAANTPATNFFITKVKVIATSNYDVNKYIITAATTLGISLPENASISQKVNGEIDLNSELNNDVKTTDLKDGQSQSTQNASISTEDTSALDTATGNTEDTSQIQTLEDTEIKAIADKFSFITPIKGNIASAFGTRTDPLGNAEFHSGIDIEANMGTSIKAALGGEVIEVGLNQQYGNYIKIQHNDGISSMYAYCSLIVAKKGQKVNQGDIIAKVGDTEGLSGSFLHFEVWKDNKAVDPEKLLNYLNQ